MRGFVGLTSVLLLGAVGLASPPHRLKAGDPWPGKWNITVTPGADSQNTAGVVKFEETLTFTISQMSVKTLADKGFAAADYTEDVGAYSPAKFACTQKSDKEGKLEWSGFTTGQDLTGNLTWTKADGTVVHYDFTGNKAP
jgi:hypothetical protein